MTPADTDRYAWAASGPETVAPGVHRIPCPLPHDGLRAVNVYVLEHHDGVTLIDTGWRHPDTVAALQAGLAGLGLSAGDVRQAICTHIHYDHYGLAGDLRDRHGVEVVLGAVERTALEVARSAHAYQQWLDERRSRLLRHGADELVDGMDRHRGEELDSIRSTSAWNPPDRLLADGDHIVVGARELRARLTPGHTRGHITLHDDAEGILFAGDHVLPHITPSLGFEAGDDGRALARYLPALEEVRDERVSLVLPGHGPAFTDLDGRIDELLEHHRLRLAQCRAALERGPLTGTQVAERLGWTRRETPYAELTLLNQMLAVTETLTHLDLLVERGAVHRDEGPPVRWVLSGR